MLEQQNSYIAFDYQAVQPSTFSPFHGGGKYGKVILGEILSRTEYVILFYSSELPHAELLEIRKRHPKVILADMLVPAIWDKIFNEYTVSCLYLPIPFSKLYKLYASRFPQKLRIVGTIHGLRDIEAIPSLDIFRYRVPLKGVLRNIYDYAKTRLPGYMKRTQRKWANLISSHNYDFFVVSNHTRDAVKKIVHSRTPEVFYSPSVINEGVKKMPHEKYFLLVSGNRWEKNNLMALRILDKMFSKKDISAEYSVKITGVKALSCYRYVFKNPDRFECLGYVEESTFSELYAKAYVLIYPSLSEGFGYPILEALSVETPVVASKLTSIPEVGGNAAIYFDPYDMKDVEKKIKQICELGQYRKLKDEALLQYALILRRQQDDLKKCVDYILKKGNCI